MAKALIEKDEKHKKQLIMKMREMHQELVILRSQLQTHNSHGGPYNLVMQGCDSQKEIPPNYLESSELVHFEVLPDTNMNTNSQTNVLRNFTTNGKENVDDSYAHE